MPIPGMAGWAHTTTHQGAGGTLPQAGTPWLLGALLGQEATENLRNTWQAGA